MVKSFNRQKRIQELKNKHFVFEKSLQREYKKPILDDLKILNLKKQKLQVKDLINNITNF